MCSGLFPQDLQSGSHPLIWWLGPNLSHHISEQISEYKWQQSAIGRQWKSCISFSKAPLCTRCSVLGQKATMVVTLQNHSGILSCTACINTAESRHKYLVVGHKWTMVVTLQNRVSHHPQNRAGILTWQAWCLAINQRWPLSSRITLAFSTVPPPLLAISPLLSGRFPAGGGGGGGQS